MEEIDKSPSSHPRNNERIIITNLPLQLYPYCMRQYEDQEPQR